ncbi:MAG: hypothetical protein KBC57_05305 [Neisseriaceae bacterium]|nr:hypothetical protein [Neisseriaceae bacterium]MBP6861757.1 hypothetical protein [Neisseriaceae bacterium]
MKITQIANVDTLVFALCEDGSLWSMDVKDQRWRRCADIQSLAEVRQSRQEKMLKSLNLSNRTFRALSSAGVVNVHQLIKLSVRDLKSIPRLGAKSIYEIENALGQVDEKLYDDGVF